MPDPEGSDGGDTGGGSDKWEIIRKIILLILQALGIACAIAEALNSANAEQASKLKPQFNNALNNIKNVQKQSESLSKKYLDRLTNTKDKQEYSNLLKSFKEQSEITKKIQNKIARIEYASEKNNYTAVIEDLNSFKTDFDKVMQKTRETRPLNKIEEFEKQYKLNPYQTKTNRSPITNKKLLDGGTFLYSLGPNNINIAKDAWKASSHDFKYSKNFINRNGYIIFSIKELPSKSLQNMVMQKLKSQLHVTDTLGVVFRYNSRISNIISRSDEIKSFFLENKSDLLNGKIINSSHRFDKHSDLKNFLGKDDIIYAHLDKDIMLNFIILDTYDFNPNENEIIQMAREVQEANLIRNYYLLILVKIPLYKWLFWLLIDKYK